MDSKKKMTRQGISFGISTAIMTLLPFQIGLVMSGNNDVREIASSIAAMSIADSMADAYGIYFSDETTNVNKKDAFIAAITTFFSKLICQLAFIVPFFFLSGVMTPTIVNFIWGFILLLGATYQVASIRKFSKTKYILQTAIFTILAIVASYSSSSFIGRFLR